MSVEAAPPRAALAMISFAQNREDVLLDRVFKDAATGFYIDIGAYHPTIGSVTKTFYDRGWSGINVEPGAVFDDLARERPRDINVRAVVVDREGEVDFFENSSDPGMSKVAEGPVTADREGRMLRVRAVTLDSLIAQHATGQEINFLKIDAEGSEAAIIGAANWKLVRPQVLVIEATAPWSNELVNQNWEPTLLANGFLRAYFDGVNVFYVRAESEGLLRHFQAPVNVLDNYVPFEQWNLNAAVEQLAAERTQIIAERDQFFTECDAQRQKSAELQERSVELTAAIEQAEAEGERLTAQAAVLSAQLAQERELAQAEAKRLVAALSEQLMQQQEHAGAEAKRLADLVVALSEQLAQERELAEAEGKRLADNTAALSKQLAQQHSSLALATSRASRYDRLVLELRDDDGPRALRSVLPLARNVRRFHHVVGRDNSIRSTPASSSVAPPTGVSPPSSSSTQSGLRPIVKKGVFGIYKALFRPIVRPAMWRVRTFLLQPLFERLDRQRSGEIGALQGSADIGVLPQGSASIDALRHEQAQLVKSLETLALTIASNAQRER
ncbi:FkbM family methyltransferase [Mesorhizobium sp. MSK_1335]|uniref:FkbM family methyltransferase n=1 Tax=Mesorhizobium montanum TaxID=3072323 RepID=A0ABU4ZGH8_9HYPH|nr:FkbM family methyltransferase [Mesorhizobium sp. MSK_1335]MDX8524479.1 FkbM family methyltransferase [Mesorhizobium sp. MSK_1335]